MKDRLEKYLKETQGLSDQDILKLIKTYSDEWDSEFHTFLSGEKAFWQNDFEEAIKCYLKSKNLPLQPFFCFRASAYLSEKIGQKEKALDYAKKALNLIPYDKKTACLLKNSPKELKNIFQDHSASSLFVQKEPPKEILLNPPPSSFFHTGKDRILEILSDFEKHQKDLKERYQKHLQERPLCDNNFLTLLNGWQPRQKTDPILIHHDRLKNPSTGLFIRWNQKGIVINPGLRFLDHFHQAGYLIQDIDFVIITQCHQHTYSDLISIYRLNEKLNEIGSTRHKIHYYINGHVFQEMSSTLKPHYKEERHMVHSLEIFADSSGCETVPLEEGILLKYFSLAPSAKDPYKRNTLGIALDLSKAQTKVKIGYLSGSSWSPLLAPHLNGCQVLLAGLGYTTAEDYKREKYLPDCLGYHGIMSLMETLSPHLLICLEFLGHKGDLRLDLIHQIKKQKNTLAFAADLDFFLDLKLMQIRCNATNVLHEPKDIHTVRGQGPFSRLQFLSKECVI